MSSEPETTSQAPFEDITLPCADCGVDFVHTVADQERYAQKGFTHHPKRCPTCREKRRSEQPAKAPRPPSAQRSSEGMAPRRSSFDRDRGDRGDRGGDRGPRRGGFGGGRGGGGGDRGPRQDFAATCAACGAQTTVPFKPTEGRPVYCRDCYRSRRPAR